LISCLRQSSAEVSLVIPCDVPGILTADFVGILMNWDRKSDALFLSTAGAVEPLIGLYTRRALVALEQMVAQGVLAPRKLGNFCAVQHLPGRVLVNVNTPSEWARWVSREHRSSGVIGYAQSVSGSFQPSGPDPIGNQIRE
jgi:molybdopterin-guanine dinucleotide biosynthesis protein A